MHSSVSGLRLIPDVRTVTSTALCVHEEASAGAHSFPSAPVTAINRSIGLKFRPPGVKAMQDLAL